MKYLLTIDAGTGSGRALVFDLAGNQIASVSREWLLPPDPRYPGSAVFKTSAAWKLICECIHEVLAKSKVPPDDILAATATSMREGFVLYDQSKREIWGCPNIDARASQEAAQMIKKGLDKVIYRIAGDGLAITAPPRLLWIASHEPQIFKATRHFSMISDWVLFKLSGEIVTDPSCGSSSGLFAIQQNTWSSELLDLLCLPMIFPPVLQSGTVIGKITEQAAEQTGLSRKTLVVMGGADTQLALLGSSGQGAGALTVVGGTFWQTALLADNPLLDPKRRLRTLCHVIPGQWMTEGIGFLNGLAMRWARDTICSDLVSIGQAEGADPYHLMEKLAEKAPPGSGGVFALISDVMNAKRWIQAPATFIGFNVTNPGHAGDPGRGLIIRATQESAAFTARAHWEILRAVSAANPKCVIFCGGAAKGTLWPQVIADVFGLPVLIPKIKEATSLGASFCALVGLGEYSSLSEAAGALVGWEREVAPDPKRMGLYRELGPIHQALQETIMKLVSRGTIKAMWRAPGV